MKKIEPEMLFW